MRSQLINLLGRFLVPILLITLMSPQAAVVKANAAALPQTTQSLVQPPDQLALAASQALAPAAPALAGLPPLKAVVFVGPIDGDNGTWTLSEVKSAQETATALRSYGVNVQEFYPNQPNGTWENIKNAANGAHFIIYRGHGVYWSDMPYPVVGGFSLKGVTVSNEMIRTELHPAKNFIVMLYGCFTAGSAANDATSVSTDEARRRVEMYSDAFFDIGAGGYYADWYGDAFTSYVHALFQGKTQQQAYEGFHDYNSSQMWRGSYQNDPALALWLGWDDWKDPKPIWNNAFAGDPGKTLAKLFQSTSMVVSTKEIHAMAESDFPKRTYQVTIQSSSAESFDWTASVASPPAWLVSVTPLQGTSGQVLTLEIDPSKDAVGGSTVIHVETSTPNINQPAHDISVKLKIVPEMLYIYLPAVGR